MPENKGCVLKEPRLFYHPHIDDLHSETKMIAGHCWPSYFQKEKLCIMSWKFGGNSYSEFQDEFSCLKSILRWENIFHPLFIRRQRLEESSFCPCLPPRQLFSRQNGLNISPPRKTVIVVDVLLMMTSGWLRNGLLTKEFQDLEFSLNSFCTDDWLRIVLELVFKLMMGTMMMTPATRFLWILNSRLSVPMPAMEYQSPRLHASNMPWWSFSSWMWF